MVLGQTYMSRWEYKYMFTGTLQGLFILPNSLLTVFCVLKF
jgi:hypothetical protein